MEVETRRTSQSTKIRVANAPFNDQSGDIILRSSGDEPTDFYTSKSFLVHASPVFAGMLSLPQGDQTSTNNGPPVVTMHENAEDLRTLLLWCSPGLAADFPASLVQFYRYYTLADKYLLDTMKTSFRQSLIPTFLHSAPADVYMISRQLGWKKETTLAVRETLSYPLHQLVCETNSILLDTSARFLQDLLRYHHRRSEFLCHYTSVDYWCTYCTEENDELLKLFLPAEGTKCCCATVEQCEYDVENIFHVVAWWDDFAKDCSASLAQIPGFEKIPLGKLLCKASATTAKCQTCGPVALERLVTFLDNVKVTVDTLPPDQVRPSVNPLRYLQFTSE